MLNPAAESTKQEKALKRVLTISRLDGWSVIVFAVLGILLTLVIGDISGLGVGLLIGVAGWMEVRGHNLLKQRKPDGMRWLVRSQMFLLAVILVYCSSRLGSFDEETVMSSLTPEMETILSEAGIGKNDILPLVRTAFFAVYGGVAIATLLYQGGMAMYYKSKTTPVTEVLTAPPVVFPHPSNSPPPV